MSIYFECSEKNFDRDQLIMEVIEKWINSSSLSRILDSFSASIPKGINIMDKINWLLKFSDEWDYRKKQLTAKDDKTNESARWLVNDSQITTLQTEAVMSGIAELGLVNINSPRLRDYDFVVALGGARLSCLLRPKYANEVILQHKLNPNAIVMLSGFRQIADSEREFTDLYAKGAETEYDLICKGAEQSFGISKYDEERHDKDNINDSWAVRTYFNTPPVISIAGPSTVPDKRRANSADTYKFFFEKYRVAEGSKLLLVTSQIYVPYQQLEAIRTLAKPFNVLVETIGFPNEWSGNMQGMLQVSNYLQEIRSTIQAIARYTNEYKL